jgi:Rrf2 family protein
MKLSTRTRYGLRIMTQIAEEGKDRPVLARELSAQQDVSAAYVDQILIPLRAGGLITSHRGRHGGYRLARAADDITALEVMETIEGKLNLVDCVDRPEKCNRSKCCTSRQVWCSLTHAMREQLGRYTLSGLSRGSVPA